MDDVKKSGAGLASSVPFAPPGSPKSNGVVGSRTPDGKVVSQGSGADAKTSSSFTPEAEAGDTKAVTARSAQTLPPGAYEMLGRYSKFHGKALELIREIGKTPAPLANKLSKEVNTRFAKAWPPRRPSHCRPAFVKSSCKPATT